MTLLNILENISDWTFLIFWIVAILIIMKAFVYDIFTIFEFLLLMLISMIGLQKSRYRYGEKHDK